MVHLGVQKLSSCGPPAPSCDGSGVLAQPGQARGREAGEQTGIMAMAMGRGHGLALARESFRC